MTRKSRREIERELEQIEEGRDVDGDEAAGTAWTVTADAAAGSRRALGGLSAGEFGSALDATQRPVEFDAPPF